MKTLFLVRHAKSSWDDPALTDAERPLAERGTHDAIAMGKRLAKHHIKPDRLLCSPALRARATAQLIAHEIGYKAKDIATEKNLYGASQNALWAIVLGMPDQHQSAMLFGHNPEFTDFAQALAPTITDMPTCAVAQFVFDAKSWAQLRDTRPSKVHLWVPK